jgi:hypothetical protein
MSRLLLAVMLAATLALTGCLTDARMSATTLDNYAENDLYQVDGAVRFPGKFHLSPDAPLTLEQTIRRAGGVQVGNEWNDGGDLSSVHVQRIVSGSVVEYTLDALPGNNGNSFLVKPGDYIRVPPRTFSTPIPIPVPYGT